MLSLFKKLVVKLGGVDTSEKNHVDIFTEERITDVIGDKIANCKTGGIWIKVQELSEFHFLNTTVVGTKNLKTNKGVTFHFVANNKTYDLHSDTKEIVSDFSNVSNQWITQFSFDITEVDFDIMLTEGNTIEVKSNKKTEIFTILK
ncbi:hypothetical protein [uncultured Flavobacterium sp.]|uniref:hypothetical protein n=1 Tax=uncultured Flavobacterium sp. TaxID=165435 RepID=UPI0030ED122F|tara:strand:+ start:29187 stop:29624 length:438 start_codon:yes stop_codon:yes gene_type:complete